MKSQSVSNTSKSAEFRLSQIRFLGIVPRFAALLMLMGLVASSAYIGSSASSSDGLLTRKSVASPVIGLSDSNSTVRPPRMPGYASLLAPLPPAPETIETFAGEREPGQALITPDFKTLCVPVQNGTIKSIERDGKKQYRYEQQGRIRVWDIGSGKEKDALRPAEARVGVELRVEADALRIHAFRVDQDVHVGVDWVAEEVRARRNRRHELDGALGCAGACCGGE